MGLTKKYMMNYSQSLTAPIFELISKIADQNSQKCFVVGGFVRDLLLKRGVAKDIDIVTLGSGIELAEKVAAQLPNNPKISVFKNFGTAMIKTDNIDIEFVGARKESYREDSRKPIVEDGTLADDQNRRDFTINALAISLNQDTFGELVDPFGGVDDLQNKIIRTPLEPNITYSDDPLRMLRAIRFATQLNFQIEEKSLQAIADNKERLKIISNERIAEELNKILAAARPSVGFKLLYETGLLSMILPELVALQGVDEKEGQRHKDNFWHTLEVVDNIALNTNDLWLRWAALLHDIGKAPTKRFDKKIGWTFHGHEFLGGKMVVKIFQRLRLPQNEKMKFVQKMVLLHMRPISLADDEVTDSAVRRLLFEAGDDVDNLMKLCEADITSKNPEKVRRFLNNFRLVREKMAVIEEKDRVRNFQPPVTGEEIMAAFGLAPSRPVGVLKEAIKNAILDGVIPNERDAALQFMYDRAARMGLKRVESFNC